uniref:Uncharacterized protein n=1 Tax=Rangifer tarandus platyrhynchus TaxID=3082113 RepID=A0ACB0EZ03_RANTA|nr:unnamed protein product [Rangifer tarandus platyrhynchus]
MASEQGAVTGDRLSVRRRITLPLPQHLPISRKAGHRTQKPGQRSEPGCRRPASLAGLARGPCEARRARVPGSPAMALAVAPLREERARTSPQALRPAGLGN